MISLIAACDSRNAIAKDDVIPWSIPEDVKWFKETTTGHMVVMGRKTHESIGKALERRTNIVLSRNPVFKAQGCICLHSVEEVLALHKADQEIFVIGGEELYKLFYPFAERIYLTRIEGNFEGNKFFPDLSHYEWIEITKRKGIKNDANPYDYWHIIYSRFV